MKKILFLLVVIVLFKIILMSPVSAQGNPQVSPPTPTILRNVSSNGRTFNYVAGGWEFDFNDIKGIAYAHNISGVANTIQWIVDCRQDLNPQGVVCWDGGSNPTDVITASPDEIIAVKVGPQCYAYQIDLHDSGGVTYGYVVDAVGTCSGPTSTPALIPTDTPASVVPTLTPSPIPTQTPVPTATLTPTQTPTPTPTLTPSPTPTPRPWTKIHGGDVFQMNVNQGNPIPTQVPGTLFLNEIPGQRNTVGVVQSPNGLPFSIDYVSPPIWFAQYSGTNFFFFDSYWQTLSPFAKVGASGVVGNPGDLSPSSSVYSYTSGGTYTLDTSFANYFASNPSRNLVIYLIRGNLRITNNFSLPQNSVAVFVVDGTVEISGDVSNIEGLYIVNNTFKIDRETGGLLPIKIFGMILTNVLSLNRMYGDIATPTYEIIYQPQYAVRLLPVMGKSETIWQELAP